MNGPKITCLLGSPRADGNSDALAGAFCDAAQGAGAQITRFALRDLQYQGCIGLRYCKGAGNGCGQADDLAPVLSAVGQADIVLMVTPIYFCNMSGLLKQAFDRFFSFLVPDYVTAAEPSRLGSGKTLVLVQVQGEDAARYGDLLDQYAPALDKLGFGHRHLLRACGVREVGDVDAHHPAAMEAAELARSLVRDHS